MHRQLSCLLSACVLILLTDAAGAQSFPVKTIRIVTGGAGGTLDISGRLMAQALTPILGQSVIVENRPTGVPAVEAVTKAAPDGHTLLLIGASLWLTPLVQDVPYDPLTDLAPISLTAASPNLVAVHPSLPAKSVQQIIALAKSRPKELNYATSGTGTANHLAVELFMAMAGGIQMVRVNYRGPAAAMNDVLSGQVHMMFASVSAAMPHVQAGRLRALAVTSPKRSAMAPGMPTVAESGLPGYEAETANGLYAPAKTPAAVVLRVHQEVAQVLNRVDIKDKLFAAGVSVVASSPDELAAAMRSEMARMGKVIRDAGIRAE